ncbi:hypothetical protein CL6EHI_047800 [Entamoeba histolytica]|uniref:Uncharacterized protein n=2 Tax=Entamoeba histolytica TaxID=5759 RepID=C4M7X1_ENTH1|nr:hypothetical protein EHI_047800 [Entamoeba histolytica HM-1:IMSS]BAN38377.1 hypothetical protein [Entamoeba histolytica]EAL45215.2 hypothetical protein EHI_047800 [Entamoeba histolytica HM-1:IMSS]BAN38439.1 hypothetical protein [Entamoeba histolytica]BAN38480.1 hypothetical protein [Entamoeba histolytica]BAN39392.1 hypothetical protein [Entamoeba histolytica]|eukprot:XP_650601.2 hypothetical protein EHI_047800 [Entamoeba histolytica HM-1:IMSS]
MLFFLLVAFVSADFDVQSAGRLYDHTVLEANFQAKGVPNYFIFNATRQKELWTTVNPSDNAVIGTVELSFQYFVTNNLLNRLAVCIGKKEEIPNNYTGIGTNFINPQGSTYCKEQTSSTSGTLTLSFEKSYDEYYIAAYVQCKTEALCFSQDVIISTTCGKEQSSETIKSYDKEPYVILPNKDFRFSTEFEYGGSKSDKKVLNFVIYTPAKGDKNIYFAMKGKVIPTLFYTTNLTETCSGNACFHTNGAENGFLELSNINEKTPVKIMLQGNEKSKIQIKLSDGTDFAPATIISLMALLLFFML